MDDLLQAALTTFQGPTRAICSICNAMMSPNHIQEDHPEIRGKANINMIRTLLDANSPETHCRTCRVSFSSNILGFLHLITSNHSLLCLPCTSFFDLDAQAPMEVMQHLIGHAIKCPEIECSGTYSSITQLLYHMYLRHASHNSIFWASCSDKETARLIIRQFSTFPSQFQTDFVYKSYFLSPMEEKLFIGTTKDHPADTNSFVLAQRYKKTNPTRNQKKSLQDLRTINDYIVQTATADRSAVTQELLLGDATRDQDDQAMEGNLSRSETPWVLLASHCLKHVYGPYITTVHRENLPFEDRHLGIVGLTPDGHIIPQQESTYHALTNILDNTVVTQNIVIEVLLTTLNKKYPSHAIQDLPGRFWVHVVDSLQSSQSRILNRNKYIRITADRPP
jgi:hypothetical protein